MEITSRFSSDSIACFTQALHMFVELSPDSSCLIIDDDQGA